MKIRFKILAVTLCVVWLSATALGTPYAGFSSTSLPNGNIGITVDENCNGSINSFGSARFPCGFQDDPGPGGLPNVMTYDLLNPPGLVAGDVKLFDPLEGIRLDVIRFNVAVGPGGGLGTLVFYSDNIGGFDSGADTVGPPAALYPNKIRIIEVGPEGRNGAVYTPLPGQPGFLAGAAAPVTYTFISDTPEPGTLSLLGVGTVLLCLSKLRIKRTSH